MSLEEPHILITREKVGVLAPSVEAMIEQVRSLLERPVGFEEMGSKAVSYAVENHSLENIDRVMSLLGVKE